VQLESWRPLYYALYIYVVLKNLYFAWHVRHFWSMKRNIYHMFLPSNSQLRGDVFVRGLSITTNRYDFSMLLLLRVALRNTSAKAPSPSFLVTPPVSSWSGRTSPQIALKINISSTRGLATTFKILALLYILSRNFEKI